MLPILNDIMLDESFFAAGSLLLLIGYYFVMFAFNVASYVLMSIGMHTLAKNRWIRKPWLAWLPIGNLWIMGSISDQYQYVVKGKVKNRRKVLLGLSIGLLVIMIAFYCLVFLAAMMQIELSPQSLYSMFLGFGMLALSIVMAVLAITAAVIQYIALYDLYVSCDPENAGMFIALSIVFSVTMPFFIFACRNKERGMPPRKAECPAEPETSEAEPALEISKEEITEGPQENVISEEPCESVETE